MGNFGGRFYRNSTQPNDSLRRWPDLGAWEGQGGAEGAGGGGRICATKG